MPTGPAYVMAIDAGTTGITVLLIDHAGSVAARAYKEFPQHFPKPGWVEHDPVEIWETTLEVMKQLVAGMDPDAIAAAGITNQRETTILWERKTLRPVHNAIVWQDRRTAPICEAMRSDGLEGEIRARTGLVLDPYFSGTKLTWLMREIEGLKKRASSGELAFGTIDTWLIAKLTGGRVHATDVSNASRTLLYDIHKLDWDPSLLATFEVPGEILPEVLPSSGRFGLMEKDLIGSEIPISGVAGDQQAALFGQACFEKGMSKNTYGTGSFVLTNIGDEPTASDHGLLTTVAWKINDDVDYALEGSIFITGAAVQWLRDGLGIIQKSTDVGPLAQTVPDTGGVYFVPALVGLGAPHWDPYARGTITGITRGTTKGHIARAAIEAMAYQTKDVVDAMTSDSRVQLTQLRVDGGAAVNDLLCQFQADILGVPVARPAFTETTAMGAAYLAGIAEGFWDGKADVAGRWKLDRVFEPSIPESTRQDLYSGWLKAVDRTRY